MLSSKEYMKQGGLKCPNCGDDNIASDRIDADGTVGMAQVQCHNCLSIWVDQWKLIGYSDLEVGEQ